MKPTDQPHRRLRENAEYETLMQNHLAALQELTTRLGLTMQTMGTSITFTDERHNTASYHGCTCLSCAARTMAMMQSGVLHAVETVNPMGTDVHDAAPNHAGGLH